MGELTSGLHGFDTKTAPRIDTRASKSPQYHGSFKKEQSRKRDWKSLPEHSVDPLDTPRILSGVRFKEEPDGFNFGTILSPMTFRLIKTELETSPTKEEQTTHIVPKIEDIPTLDLAFSGNSLAEDKKFQFFPQKRERSISLGSDMGDSANKLGSIDTGPAAAPANKLFDYSTLWGHCDDFIDSQRSPPASLEQDPWSNPPAPKPSSGIEDYLDFTGPYGHVPQRPLDIRRLLWQSLTYEASSESSWGSSKRIRSSHIDFGNTARKDHSYYYDVTLKADGLYHCP